MAGKFAAKRKKKNQRYSNRLSIIGICAAVFLLLGMVSIKGYQLQAKNDAYAEREEDLKAQLTKEQNRTEEIEDFGKYVETKKYIEDVAKDKLGLVYPGEIIFKPKE